jgi:protein-disulfide isomerase
MKSAATRKRRNRIHLAVAGGGLVIAGLVIAIVVALVNAAGGVDADQDSDAPTQLLAPAGATAAGAIVVGMADAPVRVEVYLDYMCPFCGRFERANGEEVRHLVDDGTVRLEMYPLSFLDKMSRGTRYSTRAANAIATVADRSPAKVLAFNDALFARQPAENTTGMTNDQIAAVAGEAGVPQEVVNAFVDRKFEPWIASSTTGVFATGITGTPTVKINGNLFKGDLYTVGPLTQAIRAAQGQ